MDTFQRRARHQGMLPRHPKQGRALGHQEGSEPLAGAETRIPHGLEQPRRAADLIGLRVVAEQPIEKQIDVLRDLIEPILEFRRRVHAALVTYYTAACLCGRWDILQPPPSNSDLTADILAPTG